MDDDRLLHEARAVESRVLKFKEFWDDLVRSSNSLKNEEECLIHQLSKFDLEINNLQIRKIELDEITRKLKMDVDTATEYIKRDDFLKTHLGVLNQHKHLLEGYLLGKGIQSEEITLETRMDSIWKYYIDKSFELDNAIAQEESKLANRQDFKSKMYEKEFNEYKKSIEKLKVENNLLSKKLNFTSKFQED